MHSVVELFQKFGGPAAVARAIGKKQSTASEMKRRGSIPVEHWPALISSPQGQKLGLDADALVRIHTPNSSSRPPVEERAA